MFTPQDRSNLVILLELPAQELDGWGGLNSALLETEARDRRLEVKIVEQVQLLIEKAIALRNQIYDEMAQGAQMIESYQEESEYKISFRAGGQTRGKQDLLAKYVADIERLIGLGKTGKGGQLMTVWPGGGVQSSWWSRNGSQHHDFF